MRSMLSATVAFGLVSVPVKFYKVVEENGIHFNKLHKKCGSKINHKEYCPQCDKDLLADDLTKGYEYQKDKLVVISPDDLESIALESDKTIDIQEFTDRSNIPSVYYGKSYYLGPDKGGDKGYVLLAQAMKKAKKVAIGEFVSWGRSYMVMIRSDGQKLVLHMLYFSDEVRAFDLKPEAKIKTTELELAEQLIERLTEEKLDLTKYKDTYREAVVKMVEKKLSGVPLVKQTPKTLSPAGDLLSTLLDSVKKAKTKANKKAKAA